MPASGTYPSPPPNSLNVNALIAAGRPCGSDADAIYALAVRGRAQVVKKRTAVAVCGFNQGKLQSGLRLLEIVDEVFRHIHQ